MISVMPSLGIMGRITTALRLTLPTVGRANFYINNCDHFRSLPCDPLTFRYCDSSKPDCSSPVQKSPISTVSATVVRSPQPDMFNQKSQKTAGSHKVDFFIVEKRSSGRHGFFEIIKIRPRSFSTVI